MRLIGYIVAILVVLLGFVPCSDTVSNAASRSIAVEQSEEHSHEEYCSPFCYCSCCATNSIPHQVQELVLSVESFSRPNAAPYTDAVQEVSIPVWQPPQLI
jgi:hypothetical protein